MMVTLATFAKIYGRLPCPNSLIFFFFLLGRLSQIVRTRGAKYEEPI